MNGVQTRFKCKLDVKRCKRFVFPPSSLLPRSNALKTKAIRYFQTDRTLTRIVSPPLIAYPTKNLAVWSMRNLGSVEIKGIDATGSLSLQPWESIRINFSGNYTYQRALDVTTPDASSNKSTYKHQIAYTPRVSASGQAGIETPWIDLSYSFLFSGKRYALGQNIPENRLASYSDHSISAGRDFRIRKVTTSLSVEVLNLLDKNYEIVQFFPMPGRSVRATLKIRY